MTTRTKLIVATAINVVTAVNDAIQANRKIGLDGTVTLPPLRARAKMLVGERGILPVKIVTPANSTEFTP